MALEMTKEDDEKQALFERCYDLIWQDRIPVAAVALSNSNVDAFTLKEFFDFCNMRDRELSKGSGETVNRFMLAVTENL